MRKPLGLLVGFLMIAAAGFAAEELSKVPFVLGPNYFRGGDEIIIEQVVATSTNLTVGDKVTVRGRYTLTSEEKARLCLYLTADRNVGPEPVSPTQKTEVTKGSGTFELTETVKHPGHLHLSFYSGSRFGTVYFGTERQMEEISHWNVRD